MYKIQQMAIKYFYSMKILNSSVYILFIKIFKELSNKLLDNLIIIMLFYNIQQMSVKYNKCTNASEI